MQNNKIISMLKEFHDINEILGDVHRARAYNNAILEIRKLPPIISVDQLTKIKNIGKGISQKIQEYLDTGSVAELAKLKKSPIVSTYDSLGKIAGVGKQTIAEWIKLGIMNLAALRRAISNGQVTLTPMQQLGLRHYSDLNERIPRDEVSHIANYIKRRAIKCNVDKFTIAGSYRRGLPTSGDIDILMTSDDDSLLKCVLDKLETEPNFIGVLSQGKERLTLLMYGPSNKARQIDLLYVASASYFPALLYFTGSFEFNEYIRGIAKAAGYKLNQKGLYMPNQAVISSEEDIFKILDIEYIKPKMR
jgi:DNA polymerase/3'-5' exonuclease PolX